MSVRSSQIMCVTLGASLWRHDMCKDMTLIPLLRFEASRVIRGMSYVSQVKSQCHTSCVCDIGSVVSSISYCLFCRALLQKRPLVSRERGKRDLETSIIDWDFLKWKTRRSQCLKSQLMMEVSRSLLPRSLDTRGLFRKRALQKRQYSAKETCSFNDCMTLQMQTVASYVWRASFVRVVRLFHTCVCVCVCV